MKEKDKMKKKPCGYFWKVRKMMMEKYKQGDEINLAMFPKRKKDYVIKIYFKELPFLYINFDGTKKKGIK